LNCSVEAWQLCSLLSECREPLGGMAKNMAENSKEWNQWLKKDVPSQHKLPDIYDEIMTEFEKLCLVRFFKPEKSKSAINTYIEKSLGTMYISPVTSPMEEIYLGTDYKTPFVFILSTGADPMGTIEKFAQEKGKKTRQFVPRLGSRKTSFEYDSPWFVDWILGHSAELPSFKIIYACFRGRAL